MGERTSGREVGLRREYDWRGGGAAWGGAASGVLLSRRYAKTCGPRALSESREDVRGA